MRLIKRNTILGAGIVFFLTSIVVKAGAGAPGGTSTNTPPTSIPPGGMTGGIGTIPPTPGGGGLPPAPPIDPTTGIPIGGGGIPGVIPGGGITNPTNTPPPEIQEIVTPEMMREAKRVFIRESKTIRQEAEAGNPRQQHNLAVLHTLGLGVPLDHQKAFFWFSKAADEGLAESQFNVAIALQSGLGTKKDMVTSYKYYILASTEGLDQAALARDHLAKYLTREQIESGQRMARGFLRNIERRRHYEKRKEKEALRMLEILKGKDSNKVEGR